jgi:hypothetical protein
MKTRPFFLCLLTVFLLSGIAWQPGAAQAPSPISFSSVAVRFYPEFNHPTMLVISEIMLEEDALLPAEVMIQIPLNVQSLEIYNRTKSGDLSPVDYEVSEIGQWQDIRISATTRDVRLEYYDLNLIKENSRRIFDYHWLSNHPVDSLSYTIRLPFGASALQSDPSMDETFIGQDNSEYQTKALGAVASGELKTLTIRYSRDVSDLASTANKVELAAEIDENTPGRSAPPMSVVWWLVAGAVALLLMVGLYYYWFQTNIAKQPERMVQGVGILNLEKQVVFCHECGMRSRPEDSYCSNCGTELRRPTRFIEIPRA